MSGDTRPLKSLPVISVLDTTTGGFHVLDSASRRSHLLHAGALPDDPAPHDLRGGEEEDRVTEETQPEATGMAWLRFWLAASDWTPEEAARVLVGIVPRMGGSVFFPGLEPPGTIYGEDGEPPAVTAAEKLLRPEACRQTEAGPCASRELWLRQQADRISRIARRIDPAKLERPTDLISWALARGITPPWLDYAHADPSLSRMLPSAPTVSTRTPNRPARSSREENAGELYPSLLSELEREKRDWRKRYKPSYAKLRSDYPYWSHMLAYFSALRTDRKDAAAVFGSLSEYAVLDLGRITSFTVDTVEGWDDRFEDATAIALAILRWRLFGFELECPDDGLPNLDTFLIDAERDFAAKTKSA